MSSSANSNPGLTFAPVSAEITTATGDRVLAADPAFLIGLTSRPGKNSTDYLMGLSWGHSVYQKLEKQVRRQYPDLKSMRDLGMPDFQKHFADHLASLGWGRFELKKRDEFLFIDLNHSPLAGSNRELSRNREPHQAVCAFFSGFFASIFSAVSGMKLACIEITCQCEGYDWCSFLLDNEGIVNRIHDAISQNYAPLEAFQKVKTQMGSTT